MTDPPRQPPETIEIVGLFVAVFVVVVLSAVAVLNYFSLENLHHLISGHSSELTGINSILHQLTNINTAANAKFANAIIAQQSIIAHQNAIIALLHHLLAQLR
jgi:hypothetical protein